MTDAAPNRKFPFHSVLSLKLLIEYWENEIAAGRVPFGGPLLEHLNGVSELKEPITDLYIIEKHKDLVSYLMSAVIAPAQTDKELTVATVPFQLPNRGREY